ncbi:MAG: UvrD-helicase domain-containing protein [Bacilli bacterium]|nr:UvrD-helicase domain-containing protein [Bacilli bacterium]
MLVLINENMEQCIKEFYELYNSDDYISKKVYDDFVDKYQDLFQNFLKYGDNQTEIYKKMMILSQSGYAMIDKHNENYVTKKLEQYKDYFDHMFDEVDANILLDEEQRKAILIDEDYSLVIAGAGSGKTTTMAAKVKYLVEIKKVDPKQIILLAFTKKAAEELDERINGDFKLNVSIQTFHKLGLDFIRKIKKEKVSVIEEAGQYQLLATYIKEKVFPNKELLKSFIEAFPKEIHFDKKCLEYNNFNDYWNYYTDMKYEQNKNNLSKEIVKRIKRRIKYNRTINGEYVKSEGEVKIANYLYKSSINYTYEELFPQKLNQARTYKPDFTIYNGDESIYVEYYGLAKLHTNNLITSFDNDYKLNIFKKRALHQKYNTDLIELFGRYENNTNGSLELSRELNKRNIKKLERSEKDIFYRLMETSQDSLFTNFLRLVMNFISLFKEQNYQKEDLEKMIYDMEDEQVKKQLQVIRAFYLQYENDIRKENRIDFPDMINFAYHNMEELKDQYRYLNYQYVIIDEYQDISVQRYNFAKRLSDLFNAKIVAVGDDWQAIFSFSGSDVELFTKFYELMGYAEITKITKTYRNSQELIDLAGEFVSRNTEQFQKKLISDKHLNKPVELIEYNEDLENEVNDLPERLREVLLRIYSENPKHNILLLGRYRGDIDTVLESKYYKKGTNESIVLKEQPNINIEFLTVHSAKGLGYDQVILLNALDARMGFPSKIEAHPLIQLIRGKEEYSTVEYPEERRLFYVALTRTKNKIYIMCPKQITCQSEFIKEIIWHTSVEVK